MINIIIPIIELDTLTNNPEIIKRVLKDKYPYLLVDSMYWIDSNKN